MRTIHLEYVVEQNTSYTKLNRAMILNILSKVFVDNGFFGGVLQFCSTRCVVGDLRTHVKKYTIHNKKSSLSITAQQPLRILDNFKAKQNVIKAVKLLNSGIKQNGDA